MFIINFIFFSQSHDTVLILTMLIGGRNLHIELSKTLFIQRDCQMYKALVNKVA